MKKLLLSSSALLVALVLLLIACNQQEKTPTPAATTSIELENGALKFASMQVFEQTLKKLQGQQAKLDEWEKQFSGFVSMRSAFNNLTEAEMDAISARGNNKGYEGFLTIVGQGEDKEAMMNVDDDLLGTLLNKEGILYIGEDLYQVNYRKLVKVSNYKRSSLKAEALREIVSSDQARGITVADVKHQYKNIDGAVSNPNAREVTCIKDYWHGGALCCKKRFVGQIYTSDIGGFYSSVGAKSIHQRRSSGIWWADKIPQIQVQVTGEYVQYTNGLPSVPLPVSYDSGVQLDDSGDKSNFQFCVNVSCQFTINYMSSYHYGLCDDNQVRECNLTW